MTHAFETGLALAHDTLIKLLDQDTQDSRDELVVSADHRR